MRPDGSILTTIATAPELYLIQPSFSNPNLQLLHRFDKSTSVTGITEVSPDSFQVPTTNTTGLAKHPQVAATNWNVTFPHPNATSPFVRLSANLPDVMDSNGLVTLNKHKALLADSAQGLVYAVGIESGKYNAATKDPLSASNERLRVGVNGLKIAASTLYFTSSAPNLLGRVNIDPKTGAALGPTSKVVNGLHPAVGYDDFALNFNGQAFATNAAGNLIERVDLGTQQQTIVAGNINSTDITEPSLAAFGRNWKENTLFVTTIGGLLFPINRNKVLGGQLVAV